MAETEAVWWRQGLYGVDKGYMACIVCIYSSSGNYFNLCDN